jgi:uncharacterized protein
MLHLVDIGRFNKLTVTKLVDFGVYLDGGEDGEILLPRKFVPENTQVGDALDVFICYDSEDRLMATTETPQAQVGEFAHLTVVAATKVGAFLAWGLDKDLFLPFSEQTHNIRPGDQVIVYVYLDNTDRIASSMRIERFLSKDEGEFETGQSVDLMIYNRTDLGFKAIINGSRQGMLYQNEVFQPLKIGQKLRGYIRNVRAEDGKIDLGLQKTGHQGAEDVGPEILELLAKNNGFLALNEKTSPEKIYDLFGVSKKKYKIALGGLYKQRLVIVNEDGIRTGPGKKTPPTPKK